LNFNIYVKQIATGDDYTHLLAKDGSLYSMGSNEQGQLGLGFSCDILDQVEHPILVKDVCFKFVDCGKYHSVAIDYHGKVFSWGFADDGAIGTRITVSNEPSIL
jgi:alpha-tubulin suppressor-like RCC1 family protein